MTVIVSWLVLALGVWVAARVLPGMRVRGAGGVFLTAALFGLLNLLLGWFFFAVIGIATLGLGFLFAFLTRWVVDAIVLKLADLFLRRLTVEGIGTALWAALIMAGVGTLAEWAIRLVA